MVTWTRCCGSGSALIVVKITHINRKLRNFFEN
jgi:hypothetical protein